MLEGGVEKHGVGAIDLEVHSLWGWLCGFLWVTGSWAAAVCSEMAGFCLEVGPDFSDVLEEALLAVLHSAFAGLAL